MAEAPSKPPATPNSIHTDGGTVVRFTGETEEYLLSLIGRIKFGDRVALTPTEVLSTLLALARISAGGSVEVEVGKDFHRVFNIWV